MFSKVVLSKEKLSIPHLSIVINVKLGQFTYIEDIREIYMRTTKDKVITLRLTPEQHQLFLEAAINDERSLCEWLRKVATKAAKNLLN
jgi:predicted HicB family RNase H-like nuclease